MKTWLALALAAVLFVVLATANSGGYRYGVSDQAFYQPAIAMSVDPALFPRDRVVLLPQMRLWVGDTLIAAVARASGVALPSLFVTIYLMTLLALFVGALAMARGLGASWWTVAALLVLLTLRHRIAKTGANSLEGYMHPRMLAFAVGLGAFAAIAVGQRAWAIVWTAVSMLVHTTTGLWFGVVAAGSILWMLPAARAWTTVGIGISITVVLAIVGPFSGRLTTMDPAWLAVLDDKDYLFAAAWPMYAWAANFAYVAVILMAYRRRKTRGISAPGEGPLVAGLLSLVGLFLVSVPLTQLRLALAVQMQITRVFWLLDVVAIFYVAWWLAEDIARRWSTGARSTLIALIVLASSVRGIYVVHIAGERPLFEVGLPRTTWTETMSWLDTQPASWHVLADPQHVWKYGPSVRLAAARDTLLEVNKDAALAIYDRDVALRVAERRRVLERFDDATPAEISALAQRYQLDVLVDRTDRAFPFPILYRNLDFLVYDLR